MNAASVDNGDAVNVLQLTLHGRLVGYLTGFSHGRNVLSFAEEFTGDPGRPTFSLITHPDFPRAEKVLSEPWVRNQRLHPVLSNLLPEGSLRELIAQGLGRRLIITRSQQQRVVRQRGTSRDIGKFEVRAGASP